MERIVQIGTRIKKQNQHHIYNAKLPVTPRDVRLQSERITVAILMLSLTWLYEISSADVLLGSNADGVVSVKNLKSRMKCD
jgi:hypothetical protein